MPPKKKEASTSALSQTLAEFERLALHYSESYSHRMRQDLFESLVFYTSLKAQLEPPRRFLDWKDPVYRVTFGHRDPLSVAGSLAAGGRFNIGGAQQIAQSLMPGLGMAACLYAASTEACARAEAGELYGTGNLYRLTPKKTFKLWDLAKVMEGFNIMDLVAKVKATPMAARWKLQKSPLISQILGHHLREIEGDGIIYESQKRGQDKTLAFFISDDAQAQSCFTPESV